MSNKGKNIQQCPSGGWDNGDCLSHMPTATSEQLNIAKILEKPGNDNELKHYVSQLRELTQCTEDQAVTALYDCENNLERAVELLLDRFRYGNDNEWQTSMGKRTKVKVRLNTDSTSDESTFPVPQKEVDRTENERDDLLFKKQVSPTENNVKKDRKSKLSFPNRSGRRSESNDLNSCKTQKGAVPKSNKLETTERNKPRSGNEVDGWDPYTEYGEWTGELIEVVNSDVNIAKGLEDCLVLNSDLVESESEVLNDQGGHEPSTLGDSYDDPTALFVKTARSKRPPPAFTKTTNINFLFGPGLLPDIKSKLRYVFGGDFTTQVLLSSGRTPCSSSIRAPATMHGPTFDSSRNCSTNINLKAKVKTGSSDSSTLHGDIAARLTPCFNDTPISTNSVTKNTPLVPKGNPNSALISENTAHPSSNIEINYKDFILHGLPTNAGRNSMDQVSHSGGYAQQPSTSDSLSTTAPFISHQSTVAVPVPTQKNVVSHGSVNSQTTNTSHTQSTTIPHPVPHFVGQFAPSPYMFNMPGGSGNPPTLFEIEQLQLLQQQHRMLYDMHLQQQAATTMQSVLPSTDSSSTVKNSGQGLPTSFSHATAANSTVRPDIITSAVGHATQLMQTGHPYFQYPRFVLMNGYHNAYLNQQQAGQEGNTNGNTNSQLSNAAVIHGGLPVTQPDGQNQPYNNMKVPHNYTDLLDLKYGDPSKQVGFKSGSGQPHQPTYVPFTGQGIPTTETTKQLPPTTLNQASGIGGSTSSTGYQITGNPVQYSQPQQQPQQFYPSVGATPYFTAAAAVAAAAVAAASAQQQHVMGGPGSQPSASPGSSTGPNQLPHLHPTAGAPTMVYPGTGLHVHPSGHQRSAIPH